MPFFIKKPVKIEAMQWLGSNDVEIYEFGEQANIYIGYRTTRLNPLEPIKESVPIPPRVVIIRTLEGDMTADIGDWIIKGVNGEFYPCKPDIFKKTYWTEEEYAANK